MQAGSKKSDKCYSWIWSKLLEKNASGYCAKWDSRAKSGTEGQCLYEYKI